MNNKKSYILSFVFLLFAYCVVFFFYWNKFNLKKIFVYNPLISVVVTSYNYEQYLPQTLDSILAQTYKKYEVVIVDDGSKDNSVQLIKNYTKKYKNFHLYQHEGGVNKGLPKTLEFAVKKTKGDYVAFLESDDYWREDKLEDIVSLIRKNRDAVIISNAIIPFGDATNTEAINISEVYLKANENEFKNEKNIVKLEIDSFYNPIPTFSAAVIKRDALKKINFNTPIPAFLDLWVYKQILHKYPLFHTKKTTTFWRKHEQSFNSLKKQEKNYEKSDVFIKELKEVLEKQSQQ